MLETSYKERTGYHKRLSTRGKRPQIRQTKIGSELSGKIDRGKPSPNPVYDTRRNETPQITGTRAKPECLSLVHNHSETDKNIPLRHCINKLSQKTLTGIGRRILANCTECVPSWALSVGRGPCEKVVFVFGTVPATLAKDLFQLGVSQLLVRIAAKGANGGDMRPPFERGSRPCPNAPLPTL